MSQSLEQNKHDGGAHCPVAEAVAGKVDGHGWSAVVGADCFKRNLDTFNYRFAKLPDSGPTSPRLSPSRTAKEARLAGPEASSQLKAVWDLFFHSWACLQAARQPPQPA